MMDKDIAALCNHWPDSVDGLIVFLKTRLIGVPVGEPYEAPYGITATVGGEPKVGDRCTQFVMGPPHANHWFRQQAPKAQDYEYQLDPCAQRLAAALDQLSKQLDEREAQIAGLREALSAAKIQWDSGDCPRKFDEAMSWVANDKLVGEMVEKALASTPSTALASLRAKHFEEAAKVCEEQFSKRDAEMQTAAGVCATALLRLAEKGEGS